MRVVLVSKASVVAAYRRKAEELAARGVDLTLVAPTSWRDERGVMAFEPGEARGYRLEVLPIALNGSFHLHWLRGLGSLIARVRPDIVHIEEEPYNLATVLAVRAAHRVGAAVVFFTWQNLNRRYPPPFRWFERYVYRVAGHAIAGSVDAEAVLRAKGYGGPVAVIPQMGVDPERYAPRSAEPDTFTIGYAGRLVPEKGADLLLRAAAALPGDWRLVLLGGGPEREALVALAGSLGIASRTQFLPWVPSGEFAAHLRQLSALVVPSRSLPNWKEQFGRVITEAMACGVPVVGSTCGEIPNVIGDAGLVFPENDQAELTRCLMRLMADADLRAALSEAGRQRLLAHFTQASVAAATLAVYERTLALRTGAGRSRSAQ
ncbi:MAG: glycosyltransferase [Anaerolineae bacterium]